MSEPKLQGKSHDIPKKLVWSAWLKVKENGGAAGVDGVTIGQFEERLKDRVDSSEMRVKGLFVASSEMRACGAPT
jgi:hypothetical protein